jgi:hypothetical protein
MGLEVREAQASRLCLVGMAVSRVRTQEKNQPNEQALVQAVLVAAPALLNFLRMKGGFAVQRASASSPNQPFPYLRQQSTPTRRT